uniref:Uncharacterized protein n=1 Tax=Knipowitschia caucasica TaxID=637954 RepID=A0AAV2LU07_KNICA
MHGDRWIPIRVLNTSSKPITLRRNTKMAEVSACIAVEDLDEDTEAVETVGVNNQAVSCEHFGLQETLTMLGLENLDIDSCEVSPYWKGQLMELVRKYEDVFSKSKLDCGSAKDIVHRIHLSDTRPFRLPYRRVPPGQYHKLREVLSEMEELEIIRKSKSEWASPLVLVWKKEWRLENLCGLSLAQCAYGQRRSSVATPSRLSGSPWRKCYLQCDGSYFWLL